MHEHALGWLIGHSIGMPYFDELLQMQKDIELMINLYSLHRVHVFSRIGHCLPPHLGSTSPIDLAEA